MGSSAATAPLTLITAVSRATSSIIRMIEPRPARSRPVDQLLAGPGGDSGRVDPLADDEQGGNEEHRCIAETGQRLIQSENTGRRQGERRTHGDHLDRKLVPDEQGDDRRQHQVDDGGVGHDERLGR